MSGRKFPYTGQSEGLKDFDESLTVQSELESTKIGNILHKFQVTGVLPNSGRVALPADTFFGGEDFQSLSNKLFEAKENGIDVETLEEIEKNERESDNSDTVGAEHGAEGDLGASAEGDAGVEK